MALPSFDPKTKGPLAADENDRVRSTLAHADIAKLEAVFHGTGHVLMARHQKFAWCVYCFYSEFTFRDEQRGLMYRVQQQSSGNGIELVLSPWGDITPLPPVKWHQMIDQGELYEEQWKHSQWKCLALDDTKRAQEILTLAKQTFEHAFSPELALYSR